VPIYEFYCADCHTLFSFLSRTINTSKRPACPRCGRPDLDRRVSRCAISRGRTEGSAQAEDLSGLDEAKMERVMEELSRESEGIDEENPRQVARMMRKLYETSGLPPGAGFEEAIRRMEAGESPEKIEEELGDVLEADEPVPGQRESLRSLARKIKPPAVDETLYDL